MTEMTPEERRLLEKFPIPSSPMDPRASTVVQSMLDSEALLAASGLPDRTALFDPIWSPALAARAEQTADTVRFAINRGWVRYESPGGDADYNPNDPMDQAVLVSRVGQDTVFVVRHRRGDLIAQRQTGTPATYYGDLLESWDRSHREHFEFCVNPCHKCNVNISPRCGRGDTVLLPHSRGHLVLVFEICEPCLALAGRQADVNYRIGVIEARGKVNLPPLGDGSDPDADTDT